MALLALDGFRVFCNEGRESASALGCFCLASGAYCCGFCFHALHSRHGMAKILAFQKGF